MQNSEVTLRAESQHSASVHDANPYLASIPYFGFIDEIWELNYVKFTVSVFKCKWVDNNTGVHTDDIGFMLVYLKKLGYHNDPFIMIITVSMNIVNFFFHNNVRSDLCGQRTNIGILYESSSSTLTQIVLPCRTTHQLSSQGSCT